MDLLLNSTAIIPVLLLLNSKMKHQWHLSQHHRKKPEKSYLLVNIVVESTILFMANAKHKSLWCFWFLFSGLVYGGSQYQSGTTHK